jgi:hypothetical protein
MATKTTRRNGPPPVPNERARARGNPGKKSLPKAGELVLLRGSTAAPKPPLVLGKAGMELWKLAWGEASAWLASTDTWVLALLCQDVDERQDLRAAMIGSEDWRGRIALRNLDRQITDRLQLLGFTPADRTRLGVAEVRVEDDLASFRRSVSS